ATKVVSRAQASGELTVEAWITPANATQGGPARIISMSIDPWLRNFMLGQEASTYAARFRADGEQDWDNGSPTIFTTTGTATAALTHVVHTHSTSGAEVLYVNGVENETFTRMGGLSQWDATYPIIVANEGTNDRAWLGELHLIAFYDRALDAAEVEQNFTAGP
ncbi:MAG: LamG-like jellyroll fold domain-containing protein, partial [Polyangiales bacterium]